MFLNLRYSGYNRHGEQSAAGQFLILMQPATDSAKYPWHSDTCGQCGKTSAEHDRPLVPSCPDHGIVARLRAIGEAKRHSDDALVDEILKAEKYIDGCPACDAQREYASHCNYFSASTNKYPLRAIVRYVRMRQFGHWMMGSVRIGKTKITLSGSYGSDGLPKSVPDDVYEAGAILPDELYEKWSKGGGWNGAGSEADSMRDWAKKTLLTNPKNRGGA